MPRSPAPETAGVFQLGTFSIGWIAVDEQRQQLWAPVDRAAASRDTRAKDAARRPRPCGV